MKTLKMLTGFVGAGMLICALTISAQASWILLDNFDSYETGALVGQGGWVKPSASSTTSAVTTDPVDNNNQVASISDESGVAGQTVYRSLGDNAIANNTTSTLFFRFYTTSTAPNFNLGLTDVESPANAAYSINQAQIRVGGADSGRLDTRDSTDFQEIGSYNISTWYNIWIVVDNTNNKQTFYRSTGTDNGTLIGSETGYSFRTSTSSSIQTLQLFSNNATDTVLVDDIYISSGVNTSMIPEPATFGIVLSALAVAMVRRRRFG